MNDIQLDPDLDGHKSRPFEYVLLPICLAGKTIEDEYTLIKRMDYNHARRGVSFLRVS